MVELFAQHRIDCNLLFLTSRPSDAEQRRHFYDLRADITGSLFSLLDQDVYVGLSAMLGDQRLDMLGLV